MNANLLPSETQADVVIVQSGQGRGEDGWRGGASALMASGGVAGRGICWFCSTLAAAKSAEAASTVLSGRELFYAEVLLVMYRWCV